MVQNTLKIVRKYNLITRKILKLLSTFNFLSISDSIDAIITRLKQLRGISSKNVSSSVTHVANLPSFSSALSILNLKLFTRETLFL